MWWPFFRRLLWVLRKRKSKWFFSSDSWWFTRKNGSGSIFRPQRILKITPLYNYPKMGSGSLNMFEPYPNKNNKIYSTCLRGRYKNGTDDRQEWVQNLQHWASPLRFLCLNMKNSWNMLKPSTNTSSITYRFPLDSHCLSHWYMQVTQVGGRWRELEDLRRIRLEKCFFPLVFVWLVVDLPLKNDGVRQLGWWHSQLNGKS